MLLVGLLLVTTRDGSASCATPEVVTDHDYCIIGAGPGGLQLGQLMLNSGRNYAIFERNSVAGSFYTEYPRHRTLISLNKRFTGRKSPEFNLRHDWNSLLDNPEPAPMTARTKARWPRADTLVQYLGDYAKAQEAAGKIHYNTTVNSISRPDRTSTSGGSRSCAKPQHEGKEPVSSSNAASHHLPFELNLAKTDTPVVCGVVIIASGLSVPNVPSSMSGITLTKGYEDLQESGEEFEGKTVAVIGMGNAAMETVDALSPYANFVHLYASRRSQRGHFVSWESRYVGDVRAINAGILDSYLLKSLDGGLPIQTWDGLLMVPCGTNQTRKCIFTQGPVVEHKGFKVPTALIGRFSAATDPWAKKITEKLQSIRVNINSKESKAAPDKEGGSGDNDAKGGGNVGDSIFQESFPSDMHAGISGATVPEGKPSLVNGQVVNDDREWFAVAASALQHPVVVNLLAQFAQRSGDTQGPPPMQYDEVIRCLGWKHNTSLYDLSVRPRMQQTLKYPLMTGEYESVNVPGLYFAGQLGHGKDHKRSAGGFIHGFRYTTRALSRIFDAKYHNAAWGTTTATSDGDGEGDGDGDGVHDSDGEGGDTVAPAPGKLAEVLFNDLKGTRWNGEVGLGGPGCDAGALIADGPCLDPKVITSPFEALIDRVFSRIDTGSGPYQMVAVLGDGVTFRCPATSTAQPPGAKAGQLNGEYYEEVPVEYFNQRFDAVPRLVWHFGYAEQRRRLHETMEGGTLFQVHFWWYPGDCSATPPQAAPKKNHQTDREPRVKEMLRLGESIHTRWGTQDQRVRVGQWLWDKLETVNNPIVPEYWTHPDVRGDGSQQQQQQQQQQAHNNDNKGDNNMHKGPDRNGMPNFKITMGWEDMPKEASGWIGGVVDLNILNDGIWPLVLKEYSSPGCRKGVASNDVVKIKPGGAVRVVSHERSCWEATLDPRHVVQPNKQASRRAKSQQRTQVLAQWTVDRADGLVQDVVVPFVLPTDDPEA